MIPFIEILDRAHTGPICEVKEWDVKVIPAKVKEKLKEYGLEKTCTPESPVNTDDGLANEFWKAGFDLAVDTGMLCIDTRRVIKFTDEELRKVAREAPTKISVGKNENRITISSRKPEDKVKPTAAFGALGMPISEDLFIPLIQSIAQYRVIDVQMPSVPRTIQGRENRAGTPYETLAGKIEAMMIREALKRAGRLGMPFTGFASSATEYGQLGAYGIPNGPEFGVTLPITEMKTSYGLLHKTTHDIINFELMDLGNSWSMIGGYVGPPEGAAVAAVASTLLMRAVHFLTVMGGLVLDIRYSGNSGRDAIWASSVSRQAQTRNTNMLIRGITSQVFGPCTPELLYETAVIAIMDITSGTTFESGTRPTGSKYPDHASGLENKFAAEVTKAAAGENRDLANEIAKALIPKYEDRLQRPSKGKSFTECTDLKTLRPTKEWLEIYDKVWKELEDLGLRRL